MSAYILQAVRPLSALIEYIGLQKDSYATEIDMSLLFARHDSSGFESLKILVHAFVTSRVDYCNSVLASAPKMINDELQRVLNAAARLISFTSKYDRGLSALLHDELHWLEISQRVQYKLAVTVHHVSGIQH